MKLPFIFLFSSINFLGYTSLNAQPTFEWVKQIGGTMSENVNAITTDAQGNVYTTGNFSLTVDFDPGPDSLMFTSKNGLRDLYIQKLDESGDFLWAKHIGGFGIDEGIDLKIDFEGNVFLTGYFQYTVDFDPGNDTMELTAGGSSDMFILKLDADGNFIWVKQIGGKNTQAPRSIALDAFGNIYTTGFFYGTTDFDPGPKIANFRPEYEDDAFLLKLDPNGNFLWMRQTGGDEFDAGRAVTIDANGNVYTTGFFQDSVYFEVISGDVKLGSNGDFDIFIQKFDSAGHVLWVKQFGGIGDDRPTHITTDSKGDIYITGDFEETVDFDPGASQLEFTSNGENDIFILKLDEDGNLIWAKQMGGVAEDEGLSIATDNEENNVYTTGYFEATVDFDPGQGTKNLSTHGNSDIFIQALNSNGDFIWAENLGGSINSSGNSITTLDRSIYIAGVFEKNVDFDYGAKDFNLTSKGFDDNFILKLTTYKLDILENTFKENITVYPNPSNGNFTVAFSTLQGDLTLRILSITGQELETRTFQNKDAIQLTLEQAPGVYLLEIINEKGHSTNVRLIKN